jgi:hypothetical protein
VSEGMLVRTYGNTTQGNVPPRSRIVRVTALVDYSVHVIRYK